MLIALYEFHTPRRIFVLRSVLNSLSDGQLSDAAGITVEAAHRADAPGRRKPPSPKEKSR